MTESIIAKNTNNYYIAIRRTIKFSLSLIYSQLRCHSAPIFLLILLEGEESERVSRSERAVGWSEPSGERGFYSIKLPIIVPINPKITIAIIT